MCDPDVVIPHEFSASFIYQNPELASMLKNTFPSLFLTSLASHLLLVVEVLSFDTPGHLNQIYAFLTYPDDLCATTISTGCKPLPWFQYFYYISSESIRSSSSSAASFSHWAKRPGTGIDLGMAPSLSFMENSSGSSHNFPYCRVSIFHLWTIATRRDHANQCQCLSR